MVGCCSLLVVVGCSDRIRTGELLAVVMVAVTAVVFGADWRGEELQLWADQGTMGGCYLLLVSAAAERRVKGKR